MSKPKHKQGKQICNMHDFEESESKFFKVMFGRSNRTIHRSFLESWQYRTLRNFIKGGRVYEAELIAGTSVIDIMKYGDKTHIFVNGEEAEANLFKIEDFEVCQYEVVTKEPLHVKVVVPNDRFCIQNKVVIFGKSPNSWGK